jgi:tetratricopeptide (TPR) repeat protein
LSEDQLQEVAAGRAPAGGRAAAEAHLATCAACSAALGSLQTATAVTLSGAATEPDRPQPAAQLPAAAQAQPPVAAQAQPAAPAPGQQLGRYLLLHPLGSGGMGVVMAAYDPQLDRKVAIKLLRPLALPGRDVAGLRARLLREAQAMARLSHPNVLPVYDSGVHGEHLFVAMELVDGATLRQWRFARKRTRFQVLTAWRSAGRGLAAAHLAGLIHRDFKPDNVLVGKDGQVRVTDFGLARLDRQVTPESGLFASEELSASGRKFPAPAPDGALNTPMTQSGTILGTPGYMAPEQLRGEEAHASADQFSFCAGLWEALTGVLPFEGSTPDELLAAIEKASGEPREARQLPRRLRRALVKGLHPDPEQRHPSMLALVDALGRPQLERATPYLAAGGAVVLCAAVVAGAVWTSQRQARSCAAAGEAIAWRPQERAAAKARFLSTKTPYAQVSWESTEKGLDRYAGAWSTMAREACEAAKIRHEQSAELFDLRSACLERRQRELLAFSGLLTQADAELVQRAPSIALALTPLDHCSDAANLLVSGPPQLDDAGRAQLAALEEQRVKALTLLRADKSAEAIEGFRAVREGAAKLGVHALEVESLLEGAEAQRTAGNYAAAEELAHAATERAISSAMGAGVSDGLITLVRLVGIEQGRFVEAEYMARYAQAQLKLRGGDPRREAELLEQLSWVRAQSGHAGSAVELARRSLEKALGLGPGFDLQVAQSREALSSALTSAGRGEEGAVEGRRAVEAYEALFGWANPKLAVTLNTLATGLMGAGRWVDAEAVLHRALSMQAARRQDHPEIALVLSNLGDVLREQGRLAEALETHQRGLAILRKQPVPDSTLPFTLASLGADLLALGRAAEAVPLLEAGLRAGVEQKVEPADRAEHQAWLAEALWESDRDRARAKALLAEARKMLATRLAAGALDLARPIAALDKWARAHGVAVEP